MRADFWIMVAAAGLIAAAAPAYAASGAPESAQQNVRESQQYEQLLCSNPGFRAKRVAQECGPITDPEMHQNCVASFECNSVHRHSDKAPPSETIR